MIINDFNLKIPCMKWTSIVIGNYKRVWYNHSRLRIKLIEKFGKTKRIPISDLMTKTKI